MGYSLKILMKKQMYHDVISICEEAMQYKFYEEIIHIYFLEALIAIGQEKYATSHYEYYTTKFYNDLGVAPSPKSRQVYKKLQSKKDKKDDQIVDLNIIRNVLREDNTKGALICDFDYFKFLYNFEIRSNERNNDSNIYLGIITIDNIGYKPLKEDEIKGEMEILKDAVYNTVRKGDVLSQWNDSQVVILIYHVKEEDLDNIIKRVKDKFAYDKINPKVRLNIKYKKIQT